MDYKDFMYKAFEIFSPVLLLIISWISLELRRMISQKIRNDSTRLFLLYLDDSIFHAVQEVEQTIVKQIREANADGKITVEEKQKIKQTALDSVKNHIGPKGIETIAKELGALDVDKFLSTRIESTVFSLSDNNTCQEKS